MAQVSLDSTRDAFLMDQGWLETAVEWAWETVRRNTNFILKIANDAPRSEAGGASGAQNKGHGNESEEDEDVEELGLGTSPNTKKNLARVINSRSFGETGHLPFSKAKSNLKFQMKEYEKIHSALSESKLFTVTDVKTNLSKPETVAVFSASHKQAKSLLRRHSTSDMQFKSIKHMTEAADAGRKLLEKMDSTKTTEDATKEGDAGAGAANAGAAEPTKSSSSSTDL